MVCVVLKGYGGDDQREAGSCIALSTSSRPRACTGTPNTAVASSAATAHLTHRSCIPPSLPPSLPPCLPLQVCTLDKLNRYTSQGYGWLALADAGVPGAATHRVKTWRPLGRRAGVGWAGGLRRGLSDGGMERG